MGGHQGAVPYRRQDDISYSAPGRTFDWKYPPDRQGRTVAGFTRLGEAFEGLTASFDGLRDSIQRVTEWARVGSQKDYALVDAEGGPADAAEEEEGH